jgi:short subunit dehydrogenase-like uncharacterized protein
MTANGNPGSRAGVPGAPTWVLYGAYGYTGELIARLAVRRGMGPVLAGRDRGRLEALGRELGLPIRVFALNDPTDVRAGIAGARVVLHAAGPFRKTSRPMLDACLAAGASYLDITGEFGVIEDVLSRDDEARAAGVTVVPGVGFDVVPTDCLAARLAARLPGATSLELAFAGLSTFSPGTTKTMLDGLKQGGGGAVRRNGRIVGVPAAHAARDVPFPRARPHVVAIPWGDVASAWHSTGIPNITTYTGAPPSAVRSMRLAARLSPVLGLAPVQRLLKAVVSRTVKGPDEALRRRGYTDIWGEVTDASGRRVWATLTTPEGYTLTADAALRAVAHVLDGHAPAGALTPSKAFGADFVLECDDVEFQGFHEER